METLEYFLKEESLKLKKSDWDIVLKFGQKEDIEYIINEACNRYTTQCCEYLRQRCADNAELVPDGHFNGFGGTIDTESILSTEIYLP